MPLFDEFCVRDSVRQIFNCCNYAPCATHCKCKRRKSRKSRTKRKSRSSKCMPERPQTCPQSIEEMAHPHPRRLEHTIKRFSENLDPEKLQKSIKLYTEITAPKPKTASQDYWKLLKKLKHKNRSKSGRRTSSCKYDREKWLNREITNCADLLTRFVFSRRHCVPNYKQMVVGMALYKILRFNKCQKLRKSVKMELCAICQQLGVFIDSYCQPYKQKISLDRVKGLEVPSGEQKHCVFKLDEFKDEDLEFGAKDEQVVCYEWESEEETIKQLSVFEGMAEEGWLEEVVSAMEAEGELGEGFFIGEEERGQGEGGLDEEEEEEGEDMTQLGGQGEGEGDLVQDEGEGEEDGKFAKAGATTGETLEDDLAAVGRTEDQEGEEGEDGQGVEGIDGQGIEKVGQGDEGEDGPGEDLDEELATYAQQQQEGEGEEGMITLEGIEEELEQQILEELEEEEYITSKLQAEEEFIRAAILKESAEEEEPMGIAGEEEAGIVMMEEEELLDYHLDGTSSYVAWCLYVSWLTEFGKNMETYHHCLGKFRVVLSTVRATSVISTLQIILKNWVNYLGESRVVDKNMTDYFRDKPMTWCSRCRDCTIDDYPYDHEIPPQLHEAIKTTIMWRRLLAEADQYCQFLGESEEGEESTPSTTETYEICDVASTSSSSDFEINIRLKED